MSTNSSGRRTRPEHEQGPAADLCPHCRGTGFVIADVPVGHPDFGRAVPCTCTEHDRLERHLRMAARMGTLDLLQRMRFDSFILEPPHLSQDKAYNLSKAAQVAQRYAQEPSGWLLITGTYGCGKTHLAAAIANARMEAGAPVLFVVVPDLLDHLRATFSPTSEIAYDELFEQVKNASLLILDDLGAQSGTAWAQEKLFQLFNHRYNGQLPTVITSNQRLDEFEPRLRSRLLDVNMVMHIHITAGDYRASKSPGSSDLSTLEHHRDQRLENFEVQRNDLTGEERTNLREVYQICRQYAERPTGWLVLAGTYGCGKTHLAAAIANHQADQVRSEVMFIVAPDLLDHLRATFSPQSTTTFDRRFEEIKQTPLLVLDDLGMESASPWAREKLFQLLNYRYQAMLPTVLTTTKTPDEIDPWLRTRMLDIERCRFCGIIVPSYRGSRQQRQIRDKRRPRR